MNYLRYFIDIIILGGYNYEVDDDDEIYYDDILEFNPLLGQWELVDRMIQACCWHAVSVVIVDSCV